MNEKKVTKSIKERKEGRGKGMVCQTNERSKGKEGNKVMKRSKERIKGLNDEDVKEIICC